MVSRFPVLAMVLPAVALVALTMGGLDVLVAAGLVKATAVLALAFGLVEAIGRAASDLTAMRAATGFTTGA